MCDEGVVGLPAGSSAALTHEVRAIVSSPATARLPCVFSASYQFGKAASHFIKNGNGSASGLQCLNATQEDRGGRGGWLQFFLSSASLLCILCFPISYTLLATMQSRPQILGHGVQDTEHLV